MITVDRIKTEGRCAELDTIGGKYETCPQFGIHQLSNINPPISKKVRVEGLEPPCLAAPDPKSGTSTNFATPAKGLIST